MLMSCRSAPLNTWYHAIPPAAKQHRSAMLDVHWMWVRACVHACVHEKEGAYDRLDEVPHRHLDAAR